MKIDIGNRQQEHRRKHYITPILYTLFEILLAWLILSFIAVSFNPQHWHIGVKAIMILVVGYSNYKLIKIYQRQKNYKRGY